MKKFFLLTAVFFVLSLGLIACSSDSGSATEGNKEDEANSEDNEKEEEEKAKKEKAEKEAAKKKKEEEEKKQSKYEFDKPDTVRGLYVTGHSAGGEKFDTLLDLIDDTDLNSMVIDIKDDNGNITYEPDKDLPFSDQGEAYMKDPEEVLETMEEEEVYPIARIVVFKDTVLAEEEPDLSFKENGDVWHNGSDEAFVNPYSEDVWEQNLEVAKEVAEMGFQEIQFDYVRFPEGFEDKADDFSYDKGDYEDIDDDVESRVEAVTDFVKYANKELEDYDVDVSVDVFGYTVTVDNAPGIGQDIVQIGEQIDVLSSMVYPSHWGEDSLDISKPDLEPYEVMQKYMVKEKEKFFEMEDEPVSRPWIQDFSAPWLGDGNYKEYGKEDVEAQIRGLNEAGVDEFLLWNASNEYTEGVDYKPDLDEDKVKEIEKEDKELKEEVEEEKEDDDSNNEDSDDNSDNDDNDDNDEDDTEKEKEE